MMQYKTSDPKDTFFFFGDGIEFSSLMLEMKKADFNVHYKMAIQSSCLEYLRQSHSLLQNLNIF